MTTTVSSRFQLDMSPPLTLPSISLLALPPRPASTHSPRQDPIDSPSASKAYLRRAMPTALDASTHAHPGVGLITPPNSNPLKTYHSFSNAVEDYGEHDSTLFPRRSTSPGVSPRPSPRRILTTTLPAPQIQFEEMRPLGWSYDRSMLDRIEHHTRSPHHTQLFSNNGIAPPSPDEYGTVLHFQSNFRSAMQQHASSQQRYASRSPFESPLAPQPARIAKATSGRSRHRKVLQDSPANQRAVSPLAHQAAAYPEETENHVPVTQHRRRRSSTAGTARRRAHPKPVAGGKEAKSARAKSTKIHKSEDFNDYPDFAPPFSAMRSPMEHAVKAKDYGTHPLDMSQDPLRHLMHEAELELAQRLHLSGAKYLCVKRQLFEEYVKLLRGESDKQANWNKTAAQRVSNVDVTKTSVVWSFFNDIGWFEQDLFAELIDKARDLSSVYHRPNAPAAASRSR